MRKRISFYPYMAHRVIYIDGLTALHCSINQLSLFTQYKQQTATEGTLL